MAANLGLNPTNDGTLIRISIPPLTEERRKELAKAARAQGEDAKIAIRNVRRDVEERDQEGGRRREPLRGHALREPRSASRS